MGPSYTLHATWTACGALLLVVCTCGCSGSAKDSLQQPSTHKTVFRFVVFFGFLDREQRIVCSAGVSVSNDKAGIGGEEMRWGEEGGREGEGEGQYVSNRATSATSARVAVILREGLPNKQYTGTVPIRVRAMHAGCGSMFGS